MAIPLIILAIGSVLAGYVGVPHVLGGDNRIESFLESSFHPAGHLEAGSPAASGVISDHDQVTPAIAAEARPAVAAEGGEHASAENSGLEMTLMIVSIALAFAGIGIAAYLFLISPGTADSIASSLSPVRTLLLNKYYVDEMYDAAIVQPIKRISDTVLWKGVDAGLIDGTVNGVGRVVRETSGVLRLLQTGSIRTYAASLFLGVVLVLGYYLFR
jgi:NADH-quinone oxidoreductase subunit L